LSYVYIIVSRCFYHVNGISFALLSVLVWKFHLATAT
jgi:hypothetical protein